MAATEGGMLEHNYIPHSRCCKLELEADVAKIPLAMNKAVILISSVDPFQISVWQVWT